MTATDDSVDAGLLTRVLGEYREMPGLAVTFGQAQRLWGCDSATCRAVVDLFVVESTLEFLDKAAETLEILRGEMPDCCKRHIVPAVRGRLSR